MKTRYLLIFLAVACGFVYLLGNKNEIQPTVVLPAPTTIPVKYRQFDGQDIWKAINEYRFNSGVKEFKLSSELCDNIVERWTSVKYVNAHEGLDQFVKKQRAKGSYSKSLKEGGELFFDGNTVDEAMSILKGSPSHNQALLNPKMNEACVYSWGGFSLVLMGRRQ